MIQYWYWILLLPLIAFAIQIISGKRIPRGGDFISTGAIFIALILSSGIFIDVLRAGDPNFKFHQTWDWFRFGTQKMQAGILIDTITAVMLMVVTIVSAFVHLYSIGYMNGDIRYSRFFAYLSLFSFSMLGLILTDSLFVIYIFWELVGLSSYLLIGFWFEKQSAANASLKAFITNRVGDVGMFIGILILFLTLGTLSFSGVFSGIAAGKLSGTLLTVAGICLFLGAVGKSAQFPLHVWLPDAMEGPTPVSALIHAATMVAAGVYLVTRITPLLTPDAMLVIAYVGGFTALFASTIAIAQNDIKRVLAYSTVSQLGYMILALGVGAYTAGIFHLATHAMFKACLFLGSGSVIHAMHHYLHSVHSHDDAQDMRNMGGLRKAMPITYITFLIATLALSGVPLFSGFLSKDAILAGTLSFAMKNPQHWVLAFFGFFSAGLTAFYMFRLINLTFHNEFKYGSDKISQVHESPLVMTIPLMVLSFLSFFFIFSPNPSSPEKGWFYQLVKEPPKVALLQPKPIDVTLVTGGGAAVVTLVLPENVPGFVPNKNESTSGEESGEPHHDPSHSFAMILSIMIAGLGIGISYLTYYWKKISAQAWAERLPRLYKAIYHKWYIDEIYQSTWINGLLLLTRIMGWFDNHIIDGFVNLVARAVAWFSLGPTFWFDTRIVDGAVNGLADATQGASAQLRKIQTGKVQNYLLIGLAGLIIIYIWKVIY